MHQHRLPKQLMVYYAGRSATSKGRRKGSHIKECARHADEKEKGCNCIDVISIIDTFIRPYVVVYGDNK